MMTSLIIPTGTLSQLTVMNCSMIAGVLIERDRLAPFCGYCMLEILGRKQKTEEKDGEIDTEIAGQAREKGL